MRPESRQTEHSRSSRAQALFEGPLVFVCILCLGAFTFGMALQVLTSNHAGNHDLISYWAAARQLLAHANPYDSHAILQLERAAGYSSNSEVLIMRNPPWALCLVLPLGLCGPQVAWLLWSSVQLACLIFSVHMLWVMHHRPSGWRHWLGYTFGPALVCIVSGQSALLALAGLVLFLRYHQTRPFTAGLALWLCSVKPHLFLPFGAVLLLWMVLRRSFRLLAGTTFALAASLSIVTYFNPAIWKQYSYLMHSTGIEREFIPCLAVALRFAIHPNAIWLQYVPAALACCWAIYFFWTRRDAWDWRSDGALLMMVSIVASPYAWISDQSLLIPALMVGLYRTASRPPVWIAAAISAVIELAVVLGKGLHSGIFVWTAPLWLAWFLYTWRAAPSAESSEPGIEHASPYAGSL